MRGPSKSEPQVTRHKIHKTQTHRMSCVTTRRKLHCNCNAPSPYMGLSHYHMCRTADRCMSGRPLRAMQCIEHVSMRAFVPYVQSRIGCPAERPVADFREGKSHSVFSSPLKQQLTSMVSLHLLGIAISQMPHTHRLCVGFVFIRNYICFILKSHPIFLTSRAAFTRPQAV